MDATGRTPVFPMRGPRFWLTLAGLATLSGLLAFSYRYTDVFVRGRTEPMHVKFIEEMAGAWGALFVFPLVAWVVRRLRARRFPAALPLHLATAVAISFAHTSWNWGMRSAAYTLFGFGTYDYGIMRLRYFMELPNDIIWYAVFASIVLLVDHRYAARQRELRLAQLEGEVAKLKLQSLEAQLQPHFLFNALNTVSAVMYEDVAAADAILTRLGDLLRRTLRRQGVAEIPLAEEVETLELYLEILRARFADRLDVRLHVDPAVREAAVPQLVLQPIVENAVKHGDPGPGRQARVTVRAHRRNGTLLLEVEDNGPGLPAGDEAAGERGIGLVNTRRRLEQLYGVDQQLSLSRGAEGGLRVVIAIPFRHAEDRAREG